MRHRVPHPSRAGSTLSAVGAMGGQGMGVGLRPGLGRDCLGDDQGREGTWAVWEVRV